MKLIVACDLNRVIGKDGEMPWDWIPKDMKNFRNLTKHKTIVMGRKTFESIGKPLKHRMNIVLTKNAFYDLPHDAQNVGALYDIDHVVDLHGDKEVFVIGGEQIYRAFLERDLITEVYKTTVMTTFKGDAFFPPLPAYGDWEKVESSFFRPSEDTGGYPILFEKFSKIVEK